ncbi:MAG: nuclear transport factor 2 family protein [Actinomycetia bacterium]|nr:nuclear transport factor 2 family protein [Actinomycetes bacterium]
MQTEETRALVQRYYEVLPKGSADAIAELLTEDCQWIPPATAELDPVVGREAVAEQFSGALVRAMFDLSQPFKLDVHRMVVDGPTAVVQQRLSATAANGNRYENEYCWVYHCRDGKIAHMEEYADTLLAARVMGWSAN